MIVPESCLELIKIQRHPQIKTIEQYKKTIQKEYDEMEFLLPDKCNSILDIGCGLGGIDVLLSKRYDNPKLYLFDSINMSENITYGFDKEECFYNCFVATDILMIANEIQNYNIIDVENGFPELNNIDLVISLLSLGYHYKIETYIDSLYKSMANNGKLIIDIRQCTPGILILKKYFQEIYPISHYNKSYRVCAIKKGA